MTRVGRSASEILKDALAMEADGMEFFERAAGMMTRKRSKDMFTSLASQEKKHIEVLGRELDLIEDGEDWSSLDEAKRSSKQPRHSVFSERAVSRIKLEPGAGELEVVDLGIVVEERSIEYYRAAGQASENPKAKQVFNWLVGEESGHLTILRAERDSRAGSGFYYDSMEFSLETE